MDERFRITKRAVDALPQVQKARVFYDAELKGFGIRVMPSGAKTFVVEYRPSDGGRSVAKRRHKLGAYGEITPDQARDMARDVLAEVRLGGDPAGARAEERAAPTVAEMTARWLAEEVRLKKKPKTAVGYAALVRNHIVPAMGARKAAAVTEADVARLHRRVGTTARVGANRTVAALSAAFSWAQRARMVPKGHNPCQGLAKFRETRREAFLTDAQLEGLGAAIREAETDGIPWEPDPSGKVKHAPKEENRRIRISPFAAAALRLLIFTGARLGEVLTLRWEHVDIARGVLLLPDSKTGRKTVILNAPALAVLANLPRLGPFVIPGDDPKRPRADLKKPWALVARRAGFIDAVEKLGEDGKPLKDRAGRPLMEERATVRLHDLRHTHASVGAGAGLGLHMIGKLLGHTQAATTQRYAHLADDPLRQASETIGARLAAAMGEPARAQGEAQVVPLPKAAPGRRKAPRG
ncbi:site-specific integrase [Xanthobacter tagetidis]|uniref:DUF4102 domain-containing protein n=1 Tax=Xanthobacter tagetidis TaxID=60216 RepID=A0A3L7A3Y5_9HYPH|nr:site-specific integrase [Xanthobacter tagetidis]MBB6307150.1 integrase [Xanthobacter tagetidis]RLP73992.1 DUF4102 domain-containing protein [Xanthobacter tagetidis]